MTVQIQGLQHLERLLTQTLPKTVQQSVVAGALREAARPIVAAAKAGYRGLGGSGSLAQATTAWRNRKAERRGGHFASVEVGPRRGDRKALALYYAYYRSRKGVAVKTLRAGIRHGHLVEWGTKRATGRRIMTKAFDTMGPQAVSQFRRILGERIEKAAARAGRSQRVRR